MTGSCYNLLSSWFTTCQALCKALYGIITFNPHRHLIIRQYYYLLKAGEEISNSEISVCTKSSSSKCWSQDSYFVCLASKYKSFPCRLSRMYTRPNVLELPKPTRTWELRKHGHWIWCLIYLTEIIHPLSVLTQTLRINLNSWYFPDNVTCCQLNSKVTHKITACGWSIFTLITWK